MALQLMYKSSEVRLTQMLPDLRVQPTGWAALHFHLDQLLEEYKSEYQIKIAINLINDLLKNYEGHLFLMVDQSILVLCNRLETVIQEKLVFQLRYLFMDDPLSYTESGLENPEFVTVYDIKHNWQAFNDLCARYMALVARRQPIGHQPMHVSMADITAAMRPDAAYGLGERLPVLEKLDAAVQLAPAELNVAGLAAMEEALRAIDLHATLRRQPVCAVYADRSLRRLYDEVYINIAHLRRLLRTDVDFFSNRWLFRYITQILDMRMIELMQEKQESFTDSAISLNLNVETLISSRFSQLDALIPEAKKLSIVIEVPVVDAFADMRAFRLAVSETQRRGYRVCLDGLSAGSFTAINRDVLDVDLLKVQWSGETASESNKTLAEAVQRAGSKRVILCRCDNQNAVNFGQSLGISLFQGRHIDSLINPSSKVEN